MKSHTYRSLRSYPRKFAAVTLLAMVTLCVQHVPSAFAACPNPDGCLPGGDDDPPPDDPPPPPPPPPPPVDPCPTTIFWDADHDGLNDYKENCLLDRYAPVLYMPFGIPDWTWPANVDWYLARTALRFHHNNCNDDQVLGLGAVNQNSLITQSHNTKQGWTSGCDHTSTVISSKSGPYNSDHHFFLQPPNDATHSGSSDPAQWKVYGHAYKNSIGGVNLQYWFFYPYNDNTASVNHEGDWESIIVRLTSAYTANGVYFCAHGDCSTFRSASTMSWLDSTHPIAWVADGSHASYPNESLCDYAVLEGLDNSCQTVDFNRWFTWVNGRQGRPGYQGGGVVNVGEKEYPLNGQVFIQYYSRWGELGPVNSGPRTPSFQSSWLLDAYVPPPPPPPSLLLVPDVRGNTLAAASSMLTAAGFTTGTVSGFYDSGCGYIPGRVVSQSPAAGASAPAGTPVNLSIAQRPPVCP